MQFLISFIKQMKPAAVLSIKPLTNESATVEKPYQGGTGCMEQCECARVCMCV